MKSKISFFNKTIFKKNLTLYWPIWALYTIILTCMHPVVMWLNIYYSNFYGYYNKTDAMYDLVNCLYTEPGTVLIAFTSVITGLALYNYLYNHKSANMIHSLPVDRNQLFGTNVISGFSFLIVPLFFVALLMTIVALCNGVPGVGNIWIWFLIMAGTAFSAFSIVTFCAMFTGHSAALPIYVVILNYLPMWAYYIVYLVITVFGYGVENIGGGIYQVISYFSPLECFYEKVWIGHKYNEVGEFVGIQVQGGEIVVIYALVSLVLLAIAYMTYKKRQVEQAGDFITVEWLKPVFRWGAGVTGGILGGMLIREVLIATRIGCNMFAFVLIMLMLGGICYFAADMLIRKSFHVFKKKNWMGCAGFSVVLLLCFFGLYAASDYYENFVPEKDEVVRATVSFGYDVTLDGADAEEIIRIHEKLLEYNDYCEEFQNSGNWEYDYVHISYTMKNGDYISRGYLIPYEYEEMKSIALSIVDLENDVENLLSYLLCENYEEISEFSYGSLSAYFVPKGLNEEANYENTYYEYLDLSSEQAEVLCEAIIADAKAGTLMKYNKFISTYDDEELAKSSETSLEIEFKNPNIDFESFDEFVDYNNEIGQWDMYTDEYWIYTHVSFGPDCENLVTALIELGIIDSVDDIFWGE